MKWHFCNTTAETQNISEEPLFKGNTLTFHQLAILISASAGLGAFMLSFFLIYMHAANYTKPAEQRNIIRILFMVPVYAASNFLQLTFYHHAVYYSVLSDAYEAFAIAAFFSLMCQYIGRNLHDQKQFFRQLSPIQDWVLPINWFKAMCGGDRGPWRTPKSGLTWFNIIWIGVYHYCFIRVIMTIVAVVTQHYKKYCESSLSPLFAHVWVMAIESVAVAIAMYCIIQYYVQFKQQLAYHKPFLKVLSIKLVIFLSFWQSVAISVASSWLTIIHSSAKLQYPDISTGIPALLLSVEMFIFAILHIYAFPWAPYRPNAPIVFYPKPNPDAPEPQENTPQPRCSVFMALVDAFNFWDVAKAFGRGMRWLFVGVKHRHEDISYQKNMAMDIDMDGQSTFAMNQHNGRAKGAASDEGAGLIANAQANPSSRALSPPHEDEHYSQPYEMGAEYPRQFHQPPPPAPYEANSSDDDDGSGQPYLRQLTGYASQTQHAASTDDYYHQSSDPSRQNIGTAVYADHVEAEPQRQNTAQARDPAQATIGAALWGGNPHQNLGGSMI